MYKKIYCRSCVVTVKVLVRYSGDAGLARNLSKVKLSCARPQSGTQTLRNTSETVYNILKNTEISLFGFFEFFRNLKKLNFKVFEFFRV